jgi:alpha-tubulin suppressor-like RCC1 family protein
MALLVDSRRVAVWGVNQNGVLGLGSKADMNVRTPTLIPDVFCDQVMRKLRCCRRVAVICGCRGSGCRSANQGDPGTS